MNRSCRLCGFPGVVECPACLRYYCAGHFGPLLVCGRRPCQQPRDRRGRFRHERPGRRMMRTMRAAMVLLLVGSSGCATVFAKSTRTVEVTSEPEGATVTVDGQEHDEVTPTEVELDNHRDHAIRVQLDGHRPRTCRYSARVGVGWVVLDIVLGLVPAIVDAVTGAWSSIPARDCDVDLPAD